MKMVFTLLLLSFCWSGFGAITFPPTRRSEQFIVHDDRASIGSSPAVSSRARVDEVIELGSDVLLVSAEHIKRALLRDLKISPEGAGKIHLFLGRSPDGDGEFVIRPRFNPVGWQYRVDIPDRIERLKLVRGIVQVLLLEIANRGVGPKSAEIPFWMTESLSLELLSSAGPNLILQSVPTGFMSRAGWIEGNTDVLREAREFLRSNAALAFADLSHPNLDQLSGSNLKLYQYSAQVFLHDLCRLPNGLANLFQMLRGLPYCWNWETAFLNAFRSHFQGLLDVEKWWSVNLMAFTGRDSIPRSDRLSDVEKWWSADPATFAGRDAMQPWTVESCLQKLDDILLAQVEVRSSSNALPARVQVTLQQFISEWDFPLQRRVLEQVLNQLVSLRYNVPPEVVPLIDGYRLSLHNYVQRRAQVGSTQGDKRQVVLPANYVIQDAIKALDQLYRQREALRRSQSSITKTRPNP